MNIKKIAITALIAQIIAPTDNSEQANSYRAPVLVWPVSSSQLDASLFDRAFFYEKNRAITWINKNPYSHPSRVRFENVVALRGGVQHSKAELKSIEGKLLCAEGEIKKGVLTEFYGDLVPYKQQIS